MSSQDQLNQPKQKYTHTVTLTPNDIYGCDTNIGAIEDQGYKIVAFRVPVPGEKILTLGFCIESAAAGFYPKNAARFILRPVRHPRRFELNEIDFREPRAGERYIVPGSDLVQQAHECSPYRGLRASILQLSEIISSTDGTFTVTRVTF